MSERKTGFQELTRRESHIAWAGMRSDFERIDAWHKKGEQSYDIAAGSLLHSIDAMTEPHQVSHLLGYLLHTGVDHLHALKTLLADARSQHTFAPYTLIRGAIEAGSTALWILQDDDPSDTVRRALKMEYMSLFDQKRAARIVDSEAGWDEERLQLLEDVLSRNDLSTKDVRNGSHISRIVETAAEHFDLPNARLTWQMCSAAAHGRPWARQFLTLFEAQVDDGVSKTLRGQLTSNELAMALSLDTACNVMSKALTVRERLSRNPLHKGSSFSKSSKQLLVVKRGLLMPKNRDPGM